MAKRAGATITEAEGSHVVMISQAQAVTESILDAVAALRQGASPGVPPCTGSHEATRSDDGN